MVERTTDNREIVGSSPSSPIGSWMVPNRKAEQGGQGSMKHPRTFCRCSSTVELVTCNDRVVGSIPTTGS